MKKIFTSLMLCLAFAYSGSGQTNHIFYVMDMSSQGYEMFESITFNEGDFVQFLNGTGGTYNFWIVDQNNQPNFEEPGVPNGQEIYSLTVDANYPSYNTIRVEQYVFNPTRIKEIEMVKNTASLEEESTEANIYPNPAVDVLHIVFSQPIQKLSIFSLDGKLISTHDSTTNISVDHLDQGTYVLVGTLLDGSIIRRNFIKQ